jgi:uncharacterized protein YndB with AHSA1/START domain
MKLIHQTYRIQATPEQVFQALTTPETIQKWSGAPATMEAKAGTKFSTFGGAIHGSNLLVVPNQKLVQEWYAGTWEMPTTVVFNLTADGAETVVELVHEGVPDLALEQISSGWESNYLGSMRKMFAGE